MPPRPGEIHVSEPAQPGLRLHRSLTGLVHVVKDLGGQLTEFDGVRRTYLSDLEFEHRYGQRFAGTEDVASVN